MMKSEHIRHGINAQVSVTYFSNKKQTVEEARMGEAEEKEMFYLFNPRLAQTTSRVNSSQSE